MITTDRTFRNEVVLCQDGDEFQFCVFVNCIIDVQDGGTVKVGNSAFLVDERDAPRYEREYAARN